MAKTLVAHCGGCEAVVGGKGRYASIGGEDNGDVEAPFFHCMVPQLSP